jgi:hypothetical protein
MDSLVNNNSMESVGCRSTERTASILGGDLTTFPNRVIQNMRKEKDEKLSSPTYSSLSLEKDLNAFRDMVARVCVVQELLGDSARRREEDRLAQYAISKEDITALPGIQISLFGMIKKAVRKGLKTMNCMR